MSELQKALGKLKPNKTQDLERFEVDGLVPTLNSNSVVPQFPSKPRTKYKRHDGLSKEQRIALRRAQNREAAKRARLKKAKQRQFLDEKIRQTRIKLSQTAGEKASDNVTLSAELQKLTSERERLKTTRVRKDHPQKRRKPTSISKVPNPKRVRMNPTSFSIGSCSGYPALLTPPSKVEQVSSKLESSRMRAHLYQMSAEQYKTLNAKSMAAMARPQTSAQLPPLSKTPQQIGLTRPQPRSAVFLNTRSSTVRNPEEDSQRKYAQLIAQAKQSVPQAIGSGPQSGSIVSLTLTPQKSAPKPLRPSSALLRPLTPPGTLVANPFLGNSLNRVGYCKPVVFIHPNTSVKTSHVAIPQASTISKPSSAHVPPPAAPVVPTLPMAQPVKARDATHQYITLPSPLQGTWLVSPFADNGQTLPVKGILTSLSSTLTRSSSQEKTQNTLVSGGEGVQDAKQQVISPISSISPAADNEKSEKNLDLKPTFTPEVPTLSRGVMNTPATMHREEERRKCMSLPVDIAVLDEHLHGKACDEESGVSSFGKKSGHHMCSKCEKPLVCPKHFLNYG